jgi:hypothetical protein
MSRRTLVCMVAALALGVSFYFFPPRPRDSTPAVRGRYILLFIAVGVSCASWVLDGERKWPR